MKKMIRYSNFVILRSIVDPSKNFIINHLYTTWYFHLTRYIEWSSDHEWHELHRSSKKKDIASPLQSSSCSIKHFKHSRKKNEKHF